VSLGHGRRLAHGVSFGSRWESRSKYPVFDAVLLGAGGFRFTDLVDQRLRAELARLIEDAGPSAEDAEIALGEGPARQRLKSAMRALAQGRGPGSSTCPSDAARVIGVDDWRDLMDDARKVARELAESGQVEITQRGKVVDPTSDLRGPIRIRTADR
jgi:hypothetical protein